VTVGDLLGEPSVLEWTAPVQGPTLNILRDSLMDYPSLTGTLSDARPLAPEILDQAVHDVWSAYQDSRFGYVATRLPALLAGARVAVAEATTSATRLHMLRVLAFSYHAAAATMTKVGEADLSWIASDRGLSAAEGTEDITGHRGASEISRPLDDGQRPL
jgi:hypothetical protein